MRLPEESAFTFPGPSRRNGNVCSRRHLRVPVRSCLVRNGPNPNGEDVLGGAHPLLRSCRAPGKALWGLPGVGEQSPEAPYCVVPFVQFGSDIIFEVETDQRLPGMRDGPGVAANGQPPPRDGKLRISAAEVVQASAQVIQLCRTHTHTLTHTLSLTHTHTCTHTCSHTHSLTHTLAHTLTHTHTHMLTHTSTSSTGTCDEIRGWHQCQHPHFDVLLVLQNVTIGENGRDVQRVSLYCFLQLHMNPYYLKFFE